MSVWTDIVSQVDNLRFVIKKQGASSPGYMERAARLLTQAGRITYTGVGSGLNATIPAYVYLMSHAIPSQYVDATELTYDLFPGIKGSALVLNTRSGETIELIKLAETAREAGIPTVAVTNEPESTVGRASAAAPSWCCRASPASRRASPTTGRRRWAGRAAAA